MSMGGRRERMGLIPIRSEGEEDRYIWVFDLGCLTRGTPSAIGPASQAVVLRHGSGMIAVLVDDLHGVPKFTPAQMVPSPVAAGTDGLLVKQVVRANGGNVLVQALDVAQLFACVEDPSLPTLLPEAFEELV